MQAPTVKCKSCHGTGNRDISKPLLRTLKSIVANAPISIPELIAKTSEKVEATAINKRVNSLLALKLIRVASKNGVRKFEGV